MAFKSSTNLQKLYVNLCVARMAKKGGQKAQNKIFTMEKLSAGILFSLLVGYELINILLVASQSDYRILVIRCSLYNKRHYLLVGIFSKWRQ